MPLTDVERLRKMAQEYRESERRCRMYEMRHYESSTGYEDHYHSMADNHAKDAAALERAAALVADADRNRIGLDA